MKDTKTTKDITTTPDKRGIVKWQKAYNNYRIEHDLGDDLDDIQQHRKENKLPKYPSEKGGSTRTFERYLPPYPDYKNEEQVQHWQDKKFRKDVIEHLKFALLIHGHILETNHEGEPILINKNEELLTVNKDGQLINKEGEITSDENAYLKFTTIKNFPQEQNFESYNLYYWSSEENVRQGTLKLKSTTNGLPIQGTATFEVVTDKNKPQILINDAKYFEDTGTVYVLLKRKQELDGAMIYSQITFRRKENANDVYFATYTSATSNDKKPYSGLMLLERKTDDSENISPYFDFYKYVLFNKRIQIENINQAISFAELDNQKKTTSAYIRGWKKIKNAAGFYKGFFVVPAKPSLEVCVFSVKNDGTVNIWTNAQDKSYEGLLSLEFGDYNQKAIIKAHIMKPSDDDYRLTIYLNISGYDYELQSEKLKRTATNTAYGIYTCFRFEDGNPFASRFACFKIASADPIGEKEFKKLKKEHIKSHPLKTKTDIAKVETELKAIGLYNFFKTTSRGNISLGVHV